MGIDKFVYKDFYWRLCWTFSYEVDRQVERSLGKLLHNTLINERAAVLLTKRY